MYYLEELTDINEHYKKMKEEEKERQKKENKSRSILIIIIPLLLLLYMYLDARCDYVWDQCIEEYGKNYCIKKLK